MRKLIYISIFFVSKLVSQERLGLANSNYLSTYNIFLNPSSSSDSRTYMQLNLVAANVFIFNNIGYLPNFSIRNAGQTQSLELSNIAFKKFLFANAELVGPSFIMSKGNYGGGFYIRARSIVNAINIPNEVTNYFLGKTQGVPSNLNIDLRNVRFSNMSWIEYGANFSMIVKKYRKELITVGGNFKYNSGINIVYANVESLKGSIVDTIARIDELRGKMYFNSLALNSGKGVGFDVGFTYKKMLSNCDNYFPHSKRSSCDYINYKYKFGITLRDVGYLLFTKNTSKSEYDATGNITNSRDTSYKSFLNFKFNTSPKNNLPIWASLPTALIAQYDYNFGYHVYVNASFIKNLVPTRWVGTQSANLISVCPRYEFKNFEIAIPVTFQRFLYPQVGFAFRVRTFAIGVDNVLPFIRKFNTYGLNIHFSLGISLFKSRACKTPRQRIVDCPTNTLTKPTKQRSNNKRKRSSKRK